MKKLRSVLIATVVCISLVLGGSMAFGSGYCEPECNNDCPDLTCPEIPDCICNGQKCPRCPDVTTECPEVPQCPDLVCPDIEIPTPERIPPGAYTFIGARAGSHTGWRLDVISVLMGRKAGVAFQYALNDQEQQGMGVYFLVLPPEGVPYQ